MIITYATGTSTDAMRGKREDMLTCSLDVLAGLVLPLVMCVVLLVSEGIGIIIYVTQYPGTCDVTLCPPRRGDVGSSGYPERALFKEIRRFGAGIPRLSLLTSKMLSRTTLSRQAALRQRLFANQRFASTKV
jgi:hypothetical protein